MAHLLQQLLRDGAQRHPEAPAVRARGRSLTYGELETRSSQLAHLLRDRGVSAGDRVGLFFPKAVESVVAMLGVLKAGAAYVPLDPHAPVQRVAGIAADCGLRALVTTAEKRLATLPPAALACAVLVSGEPPARDGGAVVGARRLPDLGATGGLDRDGPRLHPLHLRLHRPARRA